MLRQEMDIAYSRWISRPGAYLGVLDNHREYDLCKARVHCNATHGGIAPPVVYDEAAKTFRVDTSGMEAAYEAFNSIEDGRRHTIVGGAEHNNVYFPDFIKYKQTLPECLMQTVDGQYLELRDVHIQEGKGIPMPAIDDATLTALYREQLATQARWLRDSQYVAGYVMGAEMLYPEYFYLGHGDFRPTSWRHFVAWCEANGVTDIPSPEEVNREPGSRAWSLWYRYREQAMADRCVNYYKAILDEDENHLAYYPTHGSTLCEGRRWQLGQQPDTLAAACDGMEMGHILIEDDRERRNAIMVAYYTSYGAPVIIPRLGNKQPDLSAIGGGRSFTRASLRRLFYECVGLGIHTIFPIHWVSRLHDGEWCTKDTPAEQTCREVFDEMTEASPYLQGMGRLQPQVGLLAADATWMYEWNPRWTGILQDALSHHVQMTLVTDAIICAELARRMPALVLADVERISADTLDRLMTYVEAGGKVVLWGAFAGMDEAGTPYQADRLVPILAHPNVRRDDTPAMKEERTLRELFLSGPEHGIDGPTFYYTPVDFAALEKVLSEHAPDCVLRPAMLESNSSLKDVNVYPLTDRRTLLFVLINNSSTGASFTLMPDARLASGGSLTDVLTGETFDGAITLEGNATRMLWYAPIVVEGTMMAHVNRAEDAYLAWKQKGFDVQSVRLCYANMRSGPRIEKRYALADTLLHALAIKPEIRQEDGGLTIECAVLDAAQQPVNDARLTMRITPGTFERFALEPTAEGRYRLHISQDRLPKLYDTQAMAYQPVTGRIRCILSAETDDKQSGCVAHVELA